MYLTFPGQTTNTEYLRDKIKNFYLFNINISRCPLELKNNIVGWCKRFLYRPVREAIKFLIVWIIGDVNRQTGDLPISK